MAMTVISPYVCLCFSVFIVLCIISVTPGVPFHPIIISCYNLCLYCTTLVKNTCGERERAAMGKRLRGQLQPQENKGLYFNDSSSCAVYELCA